MEPKRRRNALAELGDEVLVELGRRSDPEGKCTQLGGAERRKAREPLDIPRGAAVAVALAFLLVDVVSKSLERRVGESERWNVVRNGLRLPWRCR